jgi:hypothetical protein
MGYAFIRIHSREDAMREVKTFIADAYDDVDTLVRSLYRDEITQTDFHHRLEINGITLDISADLQPEDIVENYHKMLRDRTAEQRIRSR